MFGDWPGIETASAGLKPPADVPASPELLQWADLVFVMERTHRSQLASRFQRWLGGKRIVCLDIPDDYTFVAPALIALLQTKVPPLLR